MLHCSINDISPGMVAAASIMHPARPQMQLVSPGLVLDSGLIQRLTALGVERLWVDHDITADIASQIQPDASPARQQVLNKLQDSFADSARKTISTADIADYRLAVMDLVCELMGSPQVAPLAERLAGASGDVFAHSASVAYLSLLVALELETYIVKQRAKLSIEHARDLTGLGLGAMLHDIAKVALPEQATKLHILNDPATSQATHPASEGLEGQTQDLADAWKAYLQHPVIGYRMLESARAPASARQIVLTHHQRWDASGFPDMSAVTGGRQDGPQAGDQIHIFSRIVGAADVLERLLRDAEGKNQPVCTALHAFASARFRGWFDPIVRDTVLRRIAPFPVGSQVTLSDGTQSAVIAPNPIQPCMPILRKLESNASPETAQVISLDKNRDLTIVKCAGEDVSEHLFFLPEEEPLAKRLAMH